jgi:transposase
MCLHPEEIPPIPYETVRVAKAAFPKGNLYMLLRDKLGVFYQDEDFVSLYPQRGQPAQAPWRLAMILVMQYLENLSDRQASVAVQGRIDWKYAKSNPVYYTEKHRHFPLNLRCNTRLKLCGNEIFRESLRLKVMTIVKYVLYD